MRTALPKLFGGLALAIVVLTFALGPMGTPAAEAAPFRGRWIDVNLSTQRARAMSGDAVFRVAKVSTGKPGWETPTGTYRITRQVANETMDSATIGVPRSSPEGYYLTGILFTQYLSLGDGTAIHYNWWSPRSIFGNRPNSHGCIGMDYADAAYFWEFADIGTPVVIHY